MKLSIILLLATCLQVSAKGYSQKLNLNLKNATYNRAFSEIEQKTRFRILYSDDLLPSNTINAAFRNETLTNVMNHILSGSNLTYKVLDNKVIVISKADSKFQAKTITGTVTDTSGNPLSGVTVLIKGTTKGTVTNTQGQYSIDVPDNNVTLVFTYIGYLSQEIPVNSTTVNIALIPGEAAAGTDVVVTALGIKRSERSLGYSTQQISASQLTNAKTDNMINALNGKVAGVTINPSASGVGGSSKVVLRGNRSLAGNNQPLYVIDGVPITNSSAIPFTAGPDGSPASAIAYNGGQPTNTYGGQPDGGDGISNLNPDDIESINVLEGASAAALYGSQAANGVIVITTKKGKEGRMQINFSSLASLDNVAYKPKFQNGYGQTADSSTQSWGSKLSGGAEDNLKDFFQTGTNFTNSISLSGGSKTMQTYFSYANTTAKGVEPTNKLERNNFNFHEIGKFLNDKLTVDVNTNYITQKINNTPNMGFYYNPLTGLYLFPRGKDISPYKDQYENDNATGYYRQSWFLNPAQPADPSATPTSHMEDIQQNPWWVLYRDPNVLNRHRIILNASIKYDFTNWLNFQARGSLDRTTDDYEQDMYSGTASVLISKTYSMNGQFTSSSQTTQQKYGDLLLTFRIPNTSAFKVDGIIGTSINDTRVNGTKVNPGLGLINPNVFLIQNIAVTAPGTSGSPTVSNVQTLPDLHSQIQSVFGNLNLSYNDWIYLALTARNDWSSNLSFTPTNHYFYPSASLSLMLNQVLHLPKTISYFKLRGSFAQVGNTVPIYVTNIVNYLGSTGNPVFNSVAPFPALKPEKTNSAEAGTDIKFMDDRLSLSFTWYKSNTKNQFIPIAPPAESGYSQGYVNAGNIQNSGIEFLIGYDVFRNKNFTWNTSFNGSLNRNKVVDLYSGLDSFVLTSNYNNGYMSILKKGGQFGDIYGYDLQRDAQGKVLIQDGKPSVNTGQWVYLGNPNPKFQLGWSNTFNYKGISLDFLIDGKFGGHVMSMTQSLMDQYGVSEATGQARDAGGVKVNGVDADGKAVTSVDANDWYTSVGGRNPAGTLYMYSATVVRLRELSLGYTFPFKTGSVLKSLKLALTGRNLIYFSKKAPFDPEMTMSTGNGLSGIDVFDQPATRNIGLNLNVNF